MVSDLFNRCAFTREDRIRALVEVSQQLLESGSAAGLFVGGAIQAWLRSPPGTDLAKDCLRVTRRSSKATPQKVAARFLGEDGAEIRNSSSSSLDSQHDEHDHEN